MLERIGLMKMELIDRARMSSYMTSPSIVFSIRDIIVGFTNLGPNTMEEWNSKRPWMSSEGSLISILESRT